MSHLNRAVGTRALNKNSSALSSSVTPCAQQQFRALANSFHLSRSDPSTFDREHPNSSSIKSQ